MRRLVWSADIVAQTGPGVVVAGACADGVEDVVVAVLVGSVALDPQPASPNAASAAITGASDQ